MQIEKVYTGTVEVESEVVARPFSYGIATTKSMNIIYTDVMNETVADFLKNVCGVDAAYEDRGETGYKWLWIFNVPFLFVFPSQTGSSYYQNALYGPYSTEAVSNAASYSVFKTKDYSIRLRFFGNPNTAFVLCAFSYGSESSGSGTGYKFAKATNILTKGNGVFYALGNLMTNYGSTPYSPSEVAYGFAIDLDTDGNIIPKSLVVQIPYRPYLLTSAGQYELNFDKIPLVPIRFCLWDLKGVYQSPNIWGLPAPAYWYSPTQTEIEIAGRRFIVTTRSQTSYTDIPATSYINFGLLEVT